MSTQQLATPEIEYPESDGQPMAENTRQFRWIVTIQGGLDAQFRDDPNVFVAGDLFWYPVEGDNTVRTAPDIMVVFGRPKGDRGSYRQWEEDAIPPQVVWEILSPGNRGSELMRKFQFYEQYGVEEYYVYDPDTSDLSGWIRGGDRLLEIPHMRGWTSPRLGVRFNLDNGELKLYGRDGKQFVTYLELAQQHEEQQREAGRQRLEAERQRAEAERRRLEAERERQRAQELAARLRELGVDPDAPASPT